MNGYCYGEQQPTEKCPYCQAVCEADFVDIGVGYTQCGPFHCDQCGASEIGPYDKERQITTRERETGWYAPGAEPGSSANVIGGKVVTHRQMLRTYKDEFTGNTLYDVPGYVENWFKELRQKP